MELTFFVQKYNALAKSVHSRQFKELKNSDFHTQNYFPAMSCMKSAGKVAPGTQIFAPLNDPDLRADASELPLQTGRIDIFLGYHPKVGDSTGLILKGTNTG